MQNSHCMMVAAKLSVLFLLMASTAHCEAPPDDCNYEDYRGKTVKHGPCRSFHENGTPKFEAIYEYGKIQGTAKEYYPNGKQKAEVTFKDDVRIGAARFYYEDGTLQSLEYYVAGKVDGTSETYYPSGTIQTRAQYKNGVMDGRVEAFHENGKPALQEDYLNGRLHGVHMEFDDTGALRLRQTFENGQPSSDPTVFPGTRQEASKAASEISRIGNQPTALQPAQRVSSPKDPRALASITTTATQQQLCRVTLKNGQALDCTRIEKTGGGFWIELEAGTRFFVSDSEVESTDMMTLTAPVARS